MTDFGQTSDNRPIYRLHFVLGVLLMAFVAARILIAALTPGPAAMADDLSPANIMSSINRERSQRNLITLNPDGRLGSAAQSKADDMQARHYFSHTDPDGNYIWGKIVAAGYAPYTQLGENLAIEFYDTDSLVAAWMNSPTHRANILNEGFRDQGLGLSFGDTTRGQYHSAIANTFGSLAAKKTAPTPPAAPKPQPSPPPASQEKKPPVTQPAPPTETPPKQQPAETPASPTELPQPKQGSQNPVAPRGLALNETSTPAASGTEKPSGQAVSFEPEKQGRSYPVSRYFTLGFGVLLVLFLLTDLQNLAERRLEILGKKINNIFILILALVAVAVMYWL